MAKRAKYNLSELVKEFSSRESEYTRTGILPFDLITGGKGLVSGVIYQIFAMKGYGKSTAMLDMCKSLADQGEKSLYLEVEANWDLAESMGLFTDERKEFFSMVSAQTWEDVEKLSWAFLESDYRVMIIDSLSAITPSKLAMGEESIETVRPGLDAALQTNYLKLFAGNLKKTNKTIIFLSQMRAIMGQSSFYGPTEDAEGGYATEFYPGIRMQILGDSKIPDLEHDGKLIGKTGTFYCLKNRIHAPFTHIPLQVIFGKGVSNIYSLLCWAWTCGYLTGGGRANWEWNLPSGETGSCKGRVERNKWVTENYEALTALFYEDAELYYDKLRTNTTIPDF